MPRGHYDDQAARRAVDRFHAKMAEQRRCRCGELRAPGITRCERCALGESHAAFMIGDYVEAMYPVGTYPPAFLKRHPSFKASNGAPSRARVILKMSRAAK